jgi:hypothetical protein
MVLRDRRVASGAAGARGVQLLILRWIAAGRGGAVPGLGREREE